jgi:tetratricopeptide (TPR) repeat protein
VTQLGTIMGTPRYMAPEQHMGDVADERADQFSFCVCLFEALYGAPPFAGSTPALLRDAVLSGTIAPPPAGARVPRWLRQVLLRGLAGRPASRHSSMGALLEEIERVPARARARWGIAGALVLLTALGVTGVRLSRSRAAVCKAPEGELAGTWGPAERAAVANAFRQTAAPDAEASLKSTIEGLDRYASAWTAMRYNACAATHVRGDQSESMLDLRMECLAQARTELGALVSLLTRADDKLVAHGPEAVRGLSDLASCANTRALRAAIRPPADAATQAKVAEIRTGLANAKALTNAARYPDALAAAKPLVQQALALGYLPLEAEALFNKSRIEGRLGDFKSCEATTREALTKAVESGHEEMAANAANTLSRFANDASHFDEALLWAHLAQAWVHRVDAVAVEDNILIGLGNIYETTGRYAEAQAAYERALQIREKTDGATDGSLGQPLLGLGLVLSDQARWPEAAAMYRRALKIQEKVMASDHPDIAMTLTNLASVLIHLDRPDEALATAQRAHAIFERRLGPDHPYVASTQGTEAEARAKKDPAGALPLMRAAIERLDKNWGPDSPDSAVSHVVLGETLRRTGQPQAALAEQQHALAVLEKALGPSHPRLVDPLVGLGRAALDLHRNKLAEDSLRRAIKIGIADKALAVEAREALDRATR